MCKMAMSCTFDSMSKAVQTAVATGLTAVALLCGCARPTPAEAPASEDVPAAIAAAMAAQEDAWNAGSIATFMSAGYWQDERLMFVGSRGLTYGYEPVLANYLKSYPDGAARGQLDFENLEWVPMGSDFGLLVGKWALDRDEPLEDVSGHYSLIWKRFPEGWRIIADHSS